MDCTYAYDDTLSKQTANIAVFATCDAMFTPHITHLLATSHRVTPTHLGIHFHVSVYACMSPGHGFELPRLGQG
eukprot:4771905-Amphidinium_carterae.1